MSTSTSSPPATPAPARCSALTPTMYLPPMTAMVLRYTYPLIVTRTGGRFDGPNASPTSAGTSMPVAVLPAVRIVVRNRIRGGRHYGRELIAAEATAPAGAGVR